MKKIKKILFTTAIMAGTLMSFVVSAAEEAPLRIRIQQKAAF